MLRANQARSSSITPTARALARLRHDKWYPWVVEATIQRFKRDLFNCIDILAIKGTDTLAIQVTSGSNHAARVRKVLDNQYLDAMLEAGWLVEVWSYTKPASGFWTLRAERIDREKLTEHRLTGADTGPASLCDGREGIGTGAGEGSGHTAAQSAS